MKIRLATQHDFKYLPEIEKDAAKAYKKFVNDFDEDAPVTGVSFYENLKLSSVIFVAEISNHIIGFIIGYELDKQAYIHEISVQQNHSGKGIGSGLLNAFIQWSADNNYQNIILTTFKDIPFNMPFYQKIGFKVFDPNPALFPNLIKIRQEEKESGIEDQFERVCMVYKIERQKK